MTTTDSPRALTIVCALLLAATALWRLHNLSQRGLIDHDEGHNLLAAQTYRHAIEWTLAGGPFRDDTAALATLRDTLHRQGGTVYPAGKPGLIAILSVTSWVTGLSTTAALHLSFLAGIVSLAFVPLIIRQWEVTSIPAHLAALLILGLSPLAGSLVTRSRRHLLRARVWLGRALVSHTFRGIQHVPDKSIVYGQLGAAYDVLGKTDNAIEAYYQKALEDNPRSAGVLYNLGITYGKKGDLEAAVTYYKKALEINPGFARAYNNLGNAYIASGDFKQAVDELSRALAISPESAEAHNNLGNVYIKQEELDKAIAEFERATALQPEFAEAHYNLGVASRRKRQLDKAIASLKRAVAINPSMVTRRARWLKGG